MCVTQVGLELLRSQDVRTSLIFLQVPPEHWLYYRRAAHPVTILCLALTVSVAGLGGQTMLIHIPGEWTTSSHCCFSVWFGFDETGFQYVVLVGLELDVQTRLVLNQYIC